MELLDEARWAASSRRFRRVVIGSGDRIFMVAVDVLRSADVVVDVVSRQESLAACLALQTRGHVVALDSVCATHKSLLGRVPLELTASA